MKRLIPLIIFALMLVQLLGVVHAYAGEESLKVTQSTVSVGAKNVNDVDINYASEHKNCAQACHGHTHFYSSLYHINVPIIQLTARLNNTNHIFSGLTYGPDSPPPDFS